MSRSRLLENLYAEDRKAKQFIDACDGLIHVTESMIPMSYEDFRSVGRVLEVLGFAMFTQRHSHTGSEASLEWLYKNVPEVLSKKDPVLLRVDRIRNPKGSKKVDIVITPDQQELIRYELGMVHAEKEHYSAWVENLILIYLDRKKND